MSDNNTVKTVNDAIYENIRRCILSGQLKSGSRLREGALAQQYGVSRTPVRNSLNRLEREGLVVRRNDKLFVFLPSENDIYNLFALRCELSTYAMIQAAGKITEADISKLSSLAVEADAGIIHASVAGATRADMAFHGFLIECSQNPLFVTLFKQIEDKLTLSINRIFEVYDLRNKDVDALPSSHKLLVNNLREYMKTGSVRPLELIIEHHFSFHPWMEQSRLKELKKSVPPRHRIIDFLLEQYKSGDKAGFSMSDFGKLHEINPFYPINRSVYDLLLRNIILGKITVNEELNISEIASDLKISRNPVRDAIDRLVNEGLLQRKHKKEVTLHKYTEAEIENIYYARLALETSAATQAARFADSKELMSIRSAHQSFKEAAESESSDLCIVFDSAFHTAIINASHNPFIADAYQSLYPHIRAWIWQATIVKKHNDSIWNNIANDHERILDYLNRHNPVGSKLSMKQHLINIVNEGG